MLYRRELKLCAALACLLLPISKPYGASQDRVIVAIIDTGYDKRHENALNLCSHAGRDYTGEGIQDDHGHGTHIAGIVAQTSAPKHTWCTKVYKVFHSKTRKTSLLWVAQAIRDAVQDGAAVINMSQSGKVWSRAESQAMRYALDRGVYVVASAGNDGEFMPPKCNVYPACYDSRVVVVGSIESNAARSSFSNHGPVVDTWAVGGQVRSVNGTQSGTSQAAGRISGKLVADLVHNALIARQNNAYLQATIPGHWSLKTQQWGL